MRINTSFLFDLDGTLVDSVYQHVLAWKEALDQEGIELSVWRIHRKIGMSGGLFTNQLLRETGGEAGGEAGGDMSAERVERLASRTRRCVPPPAREGAPAARRAGVARGADRKRHPLGDRDERDAWRPRRSTSRRSGVDPAQTVVVTRDDVKYAKPDPDLFLAAAHRLGVPIEHAVVVGGQHLGTCSPRVAAARSASVCCRAAMGQDELERSGALRVYEDPADLLLHLDEIAARP